MDNVIELANRIQAGEKVEMFVEDVGAVINELFSRNFECNVQVYASETVTWIKKVD